MALTTGDRLGPYEIVAPIGAGGMGEVYQATDTRLERTVAIKVLPAHVASDPDLKQRFDREAKTISSLNHPHICTLYDVGHAVPGSPKGLRYDSTAVAQGFSPADEIQFLVMEYLEGETLAHRLKHGALPIDQALRYAIEIADALDKAHRQGVTHRDLKPGNIMLTKTGAKLLDVGLAKLRSLSPGGGEGRGEGGSMLPTASANLTAQGMILGTLQYMSPEQLEGKDTDARTDIFAYGAILYEMVTGKKAFEGQSQASLIAAIIHIEPPPVSSLQQMTPPALDQVVRTCLAKDPDERWQSAGDIGRQLKFATQVGSQVGASAPVASAAPPAGWRQAMPFALGASLIVGVVTGLAVWTLTRPALAPPAPVTRMSIVLPQTQVPTNTGRRGVAISPTGTHVVYVANEQLYLRALDELEAQPLTGTEGSFAAMPFFSPDGQWFGFYSFRDGALQKVAITGGAAVTLAEASGPFGASWGADDTILFGQGGQGILRVAGSGGTPDVLVAVERPARAHQPQMLPGSEAVLYTLDCGGRQWDAAQIVVEQVATGERTVVVEGGSDARYLPTGHLVYALGGTLLAVPFDVDRLEVTGGPVPLVEGVSRTGNTGAAHADMARTGALVYLPGAGGDLAKRTLVWVDREGREEPLAAEPRAYRYPRISPDGTTVALDVQDQQRDTWIWDFERETLTRLTFHPEGDEYGIWTPDGRRIVFTSDRAGGFGLFWRSADGAGAAEQLTDNPSEQAYPNSITPDGTQLVFYRFASSEGIDMDLHVLSMTGEPSPEPLLATEFDEVNAEISPDGLWIAYQPNASGAQEVYVRPFPDVNEGQFQISTSGGVQPAWSRDGRELFYLGSTGLMAVPVQTEGGFRAGNPEVVLDTPLFRTEGGMVGRAYDVAPDGQRFLVIKEEAVGDTDDPFAGLTQIHVVLNWFEELKARVPVP